MMAGENGRNMTMPEFIALVADIMHLHGWNTANLNGHMIKYIRPAFDCRTADFYGLTLEGLCGKKDFFTVNENRDRDLTAWVREFLAKPPKEAGWDNHQA